MNRKPKIENPSTPLTWLEDTLRNPRGGLFAESLRKAAQLASRGYEIGIRSREAAYEKGLLRVKRLPRTTVCVGNITVGGTGKTPLVMRLVNDLMAKGCRPAVLLRGYKRERKTSHPVLVRGPKEILATIRDAGDEAMELAQRLPGACVAVGADRYAAGLHILKRFPVDCFVMDDGFQHYQLHRDMNIVTMDVTDPWGGGQLLPAGLLRESPEALRRADVVVLTRTGLVSPDRLSVLREEISTFLREDVDILESRHEPRGLVPLNGTKELPLSRLKGKTVLAVSGIANPRSFEDSLNTLGADVSSGFRLRDHGGRPQDVWKWIDSHARSGQWVIMTEKDAVRWGTEKVPPDLSSRCYALRMELALSSGRDVWQKLIKKLAHRPSHAR